MTTLFVSDLHLSAERPRKVEQFLSFLTGVRGRAERLYILGDLFEVWLGDDDDTPPYPEIVRALRGLSDAGVRLHIGSGNRDFLFGRRFALDTGAELLGDYTLVNLYGERTLLTHGDLLCTRDVKYQRFRKIVRNPVISAAFVRTPLRWRKRIATRTRDGTQASMKTKSPDIMDVEQTTVANVMARYNAARLVHGHTHRPAIHNFELSGAQCQRIVLGDWYEDDDVVCIDAGGVTRRNVSDYLSDV